MKTEIITSHDELVKLVKGGQFFHFCVAFALNKGHKDAIKSKQEVKFTVGDYEVKFDAEKMCFILSHKIYFLRVIGAYYRESYFTGLSKEEVINDLLVELEKEKN